eukprot:gnl/MRDRNA2_/MRDRNA2_96087_c0_seq1.p1 gnl/MRDRNA2_/MRDRNA2_96087_c0~~gnl/MRDRNA2_/MRDRNA2_96087_c0_seq1.p1  ORF type:complete len:396 (-),score=124.56 gnl/MRDRNA2_/MRDRNA2_96087_c0_seq1:27-1214(-)
MAQEHHEYIQTKVNPILESLVTQVLLERPENPVPFMINWLSDHSKAPKATEGQSKEDVDALRKEIEALKAEVTDLEAKTGASADAEEAAEEEEEEDNDDDVEDLPPPPANYASKGPRASVSAEAYGAWNKQTEYKPVVNPKTDEEKARLKGIMAKSFLFASLEDKDFVIVVDAMLKKDLAPKEQIIKEGDDGNCMYIVDQGTLECTKVIGGETKVVKTCVEGDAFGELALLYNCPRAASVSAGDAQCIIWQLDRETFNAVVKGASMKKREKYDGFIKSVNLLSSMEMYERGQLVDALKPETYKAGDLIVKQGDPGDKFYMVEEGSCVAEKSGTEVMQYSPGDYFGELALMKNEPRAANIIAKSDVKVVAVDRKTFKALLGPLEDLLKKKTEKYEK